MSGVFIVCVISEIKEYFTGLCCFYQNLTWSTSNLYQTCVSWLHTLLQTVSFIREVISQQIIMKTLLLTSILRIY